MDTPPTVLCAIDYSTASRTALRYAASAVNFLDGRLVLLSVIDPLLAEAMAASGHTDWRDTERDDLRAFCDETLGYQHHFQIEAEIRIGSAAEEVLETARRLQTSVIVMGCHGLTGIRKMFFGSTTERVLRDTTCPVLVAPADRHAPATVGDLAILIRHIVVPVDLTESSEGLTAIGAQLGAAIGVPVMLVHVVEPLTLRARWRGQLPSMQMEARNRAEDAMRRLVERTGGNPEPVIVVGEPADEIAKVADIRAAGLVVIGLQQRGTGRVGVVAYRILTSTHVPVLAIPAVMSIGMGADGARAGTSVPFTERCSASPNNRSTNNSADLRKTSHRQPTGVTASPQILERILRHASR